MMGMLISPSLAEEQYWVSLLSMLPPNDAVFL
jgi:hypothetical protein